MTETCTCICNGCHSRTQNTVRYSFPKKLLVATSVVVVLAMCLVTAEARTLGHKIRHERRHELAQPTKDARLKMPEARSRRKLSGGLIHTAKNTDPMRLQKNQQAEKFKNATKKIIKKLKNTRRFFNEDRRVLNETKEYRDGMPTWLPTINFVDIHFHNYRKRSSDNATITEKKFMYLMPKLHKSLKEYYEIFRRFLDVEVEMPDEAFIVYNKTRHDLIAKILSKLYSTIGDIKDEFNAFNINVPQISGNTNLRGLKMRVSVPQCLKNDYIAFRAYGNLLNNWYSEFRCPRGKKVISSNSRCAAYEAKLTEKRNTRISRGKKLISS